MRLLLMVVLAVSFVGCDAFGTDDGERNFTFSVSDHETRVAADTTFFEEYRVVKGDIERVSVMDGSEFVDLPAMVDDNLYVERAGGDNLSIQGYLVGDSDATVYLRAYLSD